MNKRRYRPWFWAALPAVSAGLAGGCGPMPGDQSAQQEAAVASGLGDVCGSALDPDHDRDHKFHKRCAHYRQKHPARHNRAGNAQVTVRTMIDAQSMAEMDATTGTFDDGSTPPGSFDKVDVAVAMPNQRRPHQWSFNAHTSTGFFSAMLGKLGRGQTVTVDANVKGIDKGMDHVSVQDQVSYRPDLAVSHINAPNNASMGMPTSIAATVIERMGDMGAMADCLLSADGAVVDHANGIWVDAGGAVTCHFSYTFATAGSHALHVEVGNVRPGDYDLSNNAADATVSVTPDFVYSGTAYDATYNGMDTDQVTDPTGALLYNETDTWAGSLQSASVSGSWGTPVAFPLASVVASASSGGTTWSLLNVADLAAGATSPTQGTCASVSDPAGFNWVTVCATGSGGTGMTNVSVSEFAGDVTYHSDGACMETSAAYDCQNSYTWNSDSSSQFAERHPLSGNLTVNLGLTDAAGNVLQAVPVIGLSAYSSSFDVPLTCDPQTDQTVYCHVHQYLETGVEGGVSP